MPYRAQRAESSEADSTLETRRRTQPAISSTPSRVARRRSFMARTSARRPTANRRAPTRSSRSGSAKPMSQDRHDEWERKTHEDEQSNRRQLERQDAQSGYTPAKARRLRKWCPATSSPNGLMGAPAKVTAPTIRSAYRDIPRRTTSPSRSPTRSRWPRKASASTRATEHLADEKTMANYRGESATRRASEPRRGGDSPSVHAATQVRAQINEVDQRSKR
jgi:hypothetical protein